jgi:hypothetical protein
MPLGINNSKLKGKAMNAQVNAVTFEEATEESRLIQALENSLKPKAPIHLMPGCVEMTNYELQCSKIREGIVTGFHQELVEIAIDNACNGFKTVAMRAKAEQARGGNVSTYPMSNSAIMMAATIVNSNALVNGDGKLDIDTFFNKILDAGKEGAFNPGQQNQENRVLSTYWVVRKFITLTMREFASFMRKPSERLTRDATGLQLGHDSGRNNGPDGSIDEHTNLYVNMETGELVDNITIDDLEVTAEDVESSALYFYEMATTGRCAKLLELARKFAPIDTIDIGRGRKKSTARTMNFPVGIQVSQTNGTWNPEVYLTWTQLLENRIIEITVNGPRVQDDTPDF